MTDKTARRGLQGGDRLVLIAIIVLAALIAVITILNMAGLRLVQGVIYVLLPLALALTLLGWGLSLLVRKVRKDGLRKVLTAVTVVIMGLLVILGLEYAGYVAGLTLPVKYAVMTSPGGHRLMVMRGLDTDVDRINARRAARLAADPSGSPDYVPEDWGYAYTAYAPGPLDLFYRPDTLIEGAVYIGYASPGELMLEWEDGESVGHFYIKNPDVNDVGEMRARAS